MVRRLLFRNNLFSKVNLSKISLRTIVLIGILCRVIFAPFTTSFDFEDAREISYLYNYGIGLGNFKVSSHHPPLWQLTLRAIYPIYLILSLSCESILLERLILKMPIIISDVAISVILFRILNKLENRNAKLVALLWSLNPYSIWISSIWGKYDLIPTLLSLIALERLSSKQIKSSALLLSIGIMYKLYLIYLIPAYLIPLYRSEGREKVIEYSMIIILICTILTIFWNISSTEIRGAISPVGFHPTNSFWYAFVLLFSHIENVDLVSIILIIGVVILTWHFSRRKIEKLSIYELNYNVLIAFMFIYLGRLIIFMYHIVWSLPFILISCFGAKEIPKRIGFLYFLMPILWIICWNPIELFTSNLSYEWWCFESIQKALGMNFSLLCILIIAYLIKKKPITSKNYNNKKPEKKLTFWHFTNYLVLTCGILLVIDSLILSSIWLAFWNTIMKYTIFYSTIIVLSLSYILILLNTRNSKEFKLNILSGTKKVSIGGLFLLWTYNVSFILVNINLPFLNTISSQIVTQVYSELFFSYLLVLWIPLIVYSILRAQPESLFNIIYVVFLQIDFLITRHYYETLQNIVVQIDLLMIICVLIPLLILAAFMQPTNTKRIN